MRPSTVIAARLRAGVVVACLGAGFQIGQWTDAPLTLTLVGAACSAIVAICTRRWTRRAALVIGGAMLASAWWAVRIEMAPSDALGRSLSTSEGRLVRVEGVVLDAPVRHERAGRFANWSFGSDRWRFRLRVTRASGAGGEHAPASGVLYVRSDAPATVRTGDRVRLTGMARRVGPAQNPGAFDSASWASERGVAGFLDTNPDLIESLGGRGLFGARLADTARARARALLENADARVRPLLAATLLGESIEGLEPTRRAYTRLGVAHLLAVSGLHLAALAGVSVALLRAPSWGWRARGWAAAIVTLCYLALVPAKAPIMRAGVMMLALVAGEALGRRHDRVTTLAWAAVIVLLWRPTQLWSAGFQLSFGVVLALLTLTGPVRDRMLGPMPESGHESPAARLRWWGASTLAGAIAAWVVATPLAAAHFGVVSPLGIPAVLLLAPVFVATLCLGFIAVGLSLASPALGEAALVPVEWCAHAQLWMVTVLDGAPGASVRVAPMPVWFGLAGGLLGAWWLRAGIRTSGGAVPWRVGVTVLWLAFFVHAHVAGLRNGLASDVALRIDTFSVGDGSCHLVRTPGGAFLWDAGGSDLAAGEQMMPRAIRALGVWRVPDVMITHPNLDHYAFLPDLIEPLGIQRVHFSEAMLLEAMDPDGPEASLMTALGRAGVKVHLLNAGDELRIGAATVSIISPPTAHRFDRLNDQSLVALVRAPYSAGESRLLLTGDIQDEAIAAIRDVAMRFGAHAVEIPHHGSARDDAIEFVGALGAIVGVQSTGPSRAFDERWSAVRSRTAWLSTTEGGASAIEWRRDGRLRWRHTAPQTAWTTLCLRPAWARLSE